MTFEIVSGDIEVTENGKTTKIRADNRDASVDETQSPLSPSNIIFSFVHKTIYILFNLVPMSMEYDNLFKDAVKFLRNRSPTEFVNPMGFSPFWTTMTMYKIADRV